MDKQDNGRRWTENYETTLSSVHFTLRQGLITSKRVNYSYRSTCFFCLEPKPAVSFRCPRRWKRFYFRLGSSLRSSTIILHPNSTAFRFRCPVLIRQAVSHLYAKVMWGKRTEKDTILISWLLCACALQHCKKTSRLGLSSRPDITTDTVS